MNISTPSLEIIHHRLIVSCQPDAHDRLGDPMNSPVIMTALALAALQGGASAIRADSPADIAAIRAHVTVPILGLFKHDIPGYEVRITPTVADALAISAAGADWLAIDATCRPRPEGKTASEFIQMVVKATKKPVFADISTFEEGVAAAEAGAAAVITTLSGFTPYSPQIEGPDLDLVMRLAAVVKVPVIAEGRYHTPEQAAQALAAGAYAVTVGGAITMPRRITERFIAAMDRIA